MAYNYNLEQKFMELSTLLDDEIANNNGIVNHNTDLVGSTLGVAGATTLAETSINGPAYLNNTVEAMDTLTVHGSLVVHGSIMVRDHYDNELPMSLDELVARKVQESISLYIPEDYAELQDDNRRLEEEIERLTNEPESMVLTPT